MQRTTLRHVAILILLCLSATRADEIIVEKDVMVPMRDGVRLATDVYRPAANSAATIEKLPVILTRTPYNKNGAKAQGEYFAKNGYVFVAQDTRGRYASEGIWRMLID